MVRLIYGKLKCMNSKIIEHSLNLGFYDDEDGFHYQSLSYKRGEKEGMLFQT